MTDKPLAHVLKILNRLKLEYMLTGSYASNIYGRVRSTFDADIVVALQAAQMDQLVQSLKPYFYLDAGSMAEAREAGGQFNAVDTSSGLKVDFYLLSNDVHDRLTMDRRQKQRLLEQSIWVISPEDLILSKLAWAKKGGSLRQVEDARGIYEAQRGKLDLAYLKEWADRLSLNDFLHKLDK